MKPTLNIGNCESHRFVVTEQMQPNFNGRIIHPVCSTWDLAHQIEIAARKTLEPHLSDGEEGIGTHLSIDHLSPAPVGREIKVIATVTEVDTSTVVCAITVSLGATVIASGTQIQRVLPSSTIEERIRLASTQ